MRFSRDKRGYEHTFVVHADRRRARGRVRILYWFRTPPGVRVGRTALDPDVMALIEAQNPGVEFDWPRLLKGEGAPATDTRPRVDVQDRRARPLPSRRPAPVPPSPQRRTEPELPVPERPLAPAVEAPEVASADLEPDVLDQAPPGRDAADEEPVPDTPAGRRLGGPGLRRLRARYAEVLARIPEKVEDPARQQELIALAERLNPDAWATDEAVVAGLEQYEAAHESLRAVVGRRRRRHNR